MEQEIWKDIEGFEGLYQCSNKGRLRSLRNGVMIMSPIPDKGGYPRIVLYKEGVRHRHNIHRLVAQAFIPNPENKKTVNHKNGIKTDYTLDNLEWCTHGENNRHAYKTGLKIAFPNGNPSEKTYLKNRKKIAQYDKDLNILKTWECPMDIQKALGINNGSVSNCCKGKARTAGGFIWKYFE